MKLGIDSKTKTITWYGKVDVNELLDTLEVLKIREGWTLEIEHWFATPTIPLEPYVIPWVQPSPFTPSIPYTPYTPGYPFNPVITWCSSSGTSNVNTTK